jgi:hypothetical protein
MLVNVSYTCFGRLNVLWICRAVVVSLLAFMPPVSSPAVAQVPFEDLALRINLGDQVRIEEQSGERATGRLALLTPDEIAIQTDAGESRFAPGTIRKVSVRTYDLRRGALIGAGAVAVLGAVVMCAHGEKNCAIIGPLGGAPIGAGLGLAIGALIPRMRPVYRASGDRLPVPQSPASVQGFLADLALRANLNDRIQVVDRSGVRTTGRLTRLTPDEIAVHTESGEKHFSRGEVRQVAVRRRPLRLAVLIGAATGATAGAIAACTGPDREECADAPLMAGALGAGLGLATGALIQRTSIVYPEADRPVAVWPMISRDAIGIRVSRQW